MTIEQAIHEILQKASYDEQLWAIEQITQNLRKKSQVASAKPTLNDSEDFYFPTFHLGKFEEVSREQLYDDMSERFAFDTSI